MSFFKNFYQIFKESKIAVVYLIWVVISFTFLEVYYNHLSLLNAIISLLVMLTWFLLSFILIYYPMKKVSVSQNEAKSPNELSPYLILFVLFVYEIIEDIFVYNNVSIFYTDAFISKILYHLCIIAIVLLLGRLVLKIKREPSEYSFKYVYVILPVAIVGSTLDVILRGGFHDFRFGLIGNILRVIVAFMIAFYEEFFYRGIVFKSLKRIFKNPMDAIIISGIIFGLTHVSILSKEPIIYQIIDRSCETAVSGMVFAYIYYKTKSLMPGTTYHAIKNLF